MNHSNDIIPITSLKHEAYRVICDALDLCIVKIVVSLLNKGTNYGVGEGRVGSDDI